MSNIYTHRDSFRELVQFNGGGVGIYAPGEVTRISRARLVWVWTIGQVRGVGRCFIYILRGCRVWGMGDPYSVKQGVKPDNCQGNKFLLGLMVGKQAL